MIKPEWLLTEEEIKQIQIETNNRISRYCNDTEGHFTQTDIDTMYDEGNLGIVHAAVSKAAPLIAQAERDTIKGDLGSWIIGVDGCTFEERLDGDKGCLVLDMNMNQWNEYWESLSGEKEK